jgi:membrane protein required for colicin V production
VNTFDLIVIGVIAVSGLLALVRGFVREVLAIGAWVGAVFATVYLTAPAKPLFHQVIAADWLADIVAPIVIFIVALLLLSALTGLVSSRVRNSGMGPADRALGLVFGVARGFIIVCLAYLAMNYFLPTTSRPAWITEAKSLPLLARGATQMQAMVPHSLIDKGSDTLQSVTRKAEAMHQIQQGMDALKEPDKSDAKPQDPKGDGVQKDAAPPDYSDTSRNQLDQIVKGNQ